MKIKVGDKTYDSEETPVMVILSGKDKHNIANMHPGSHKYCAYPHGSNPGDIKAWMNAPN